jgi:DnaJ-class molecular chaperone
MAKGFLDGYETYNTGNGFGNAQKWRKAFFQRMSKEEAEMLLKATPETPYTLLGITPNATPSQIKAAFRKKIMEWHPDKNSHRLGEAEAMSKQIIAAYSMLV